MSRPPASTRARRGLISLLRTLPQTMLISTHDLRMVAELLPRTVVMDRGEIVADRPTGEVLADAALVGRARAGAIGAASMALT